MSLGEIVGRLGLWFFPTMALIIFAITFVFVVVHACAPRRREEMEHAALLPLVDDGVPDRSPLAAPHQRN